MRLSYTLDREELNRLYFPVLVEMYSKKNFGRVKRAYLNEFTERERKVISYYYRLFYRWYLVKGTPRSYTFRKFSTLELVQRAIDFFGRL